LQQNRKKISRIGILSWRVVFTSLFCICFDGESQLRFTVRFSFRTELGSIGASCPKDFKGVRRASQESFVSSVGEIELVNKSLWSLPEEQLVHNHAGGRLIVAVDSAAAQNDGEAGKQVTRAEPAQEEQEQNKACFLSSFRKSASNSFFCVSTSFSAFLRT
tara:strand:+ start:231 stop:713 length:483 start_codon:yes stop_codon:yes gene_type:complete